MNDRKYALYEEAVQSPESHVQWFSNAYEGIRGRKAVSLREDFCGTFMVCCEWVKQSSKHAAVGLDLDSEPLAYGKKKHLARLPAHQRRRVSPLQRNVLEPTAFKSDLIVACNFSFYIFQKRALLLKYFKAALKSLGSQGLLVCEMAGGPGMIEVLKEKKTVRPARGKPFTYTWEQKDFDPIHRRGQYAIHFKLGKSKDSKVMKDAFTYDWRLWTIPEVREAMMEAGFKGTRVYWETEFKGECTGEFVHMEEGDNAHSWTAYVIGLN